MVGSALNISAKMSVVMAAIFAVVCFGVAITGFTSIGGIEDPVQRADGLGFAWFWTGVWIIRTHKEIEER